MSRSLFISSSFAEDDCILYGCTVRMRLHCIRSRTPLLLSVSPCKVKNTRRKKKREKETRCKEKKDVRNEFLYAKISSRMLENFNFNRKTTTSHYTIRYISAEIIVAHAVNVSLFQVECFLFYSLRFYGRNEIIVAKLSKTKQQKNTLGDYSHKWKSEKECSRVIWFSLSAFPYIYIYCTVHSESWCGTWVSIMISCTFISIMSHLLMTK